MVRCNQNRALWNQLDPQCLEEETADPQDTNPTVKHGDGNIML